MGTVMKMKFVLAFICLAASVASMKDKHYLSKPLTKMEDRKNIKTEQTTVRDMVDMVLANPVRKKSIVLGKNISQKKVMGLVNMALIKNMNLERAMIIINMDTMTQENMILVNTDMEGQVKRLNTTGENGQTGTTV